ncbi:maleylacetoacetate isomerase [Pseudoalteromonas sp. SWXJZ94C]|uniref:maleylacetoacetate isomerase n=1 Tax=unclassified Pseudoalteromonas TaxID=194690 RepID=UPI00140BCFE1|nr:maleylacetoacetate isomerase [Pseudoalteromonas sp. SWXJZ94C]
MKLYTYWRSSAAYRVRIGLSLKGLPYKSVPVHLLRDGGEQLKQSYAKINPQRQVPSMELDDGTILIQSLAILEYLDETYPEPPLLPCEPVDRARVRALSQVIACDIHPVNNLNVLNYLINDMKVDPENKVIWYRNTIEKGFPALEKLLTCSTKTGKFCHGDTPTLADVLLVPQVYNARRFDVDLSPFPTICRIEAACLELDSFRAAIPEVQADAHKI